MRKILTFLALAGLVSSLAFASSLSAAPGNKYSDTVSEPCGSNGTDGSVEWSPATLWPPNHKYVTVTITVLDTDDTDGDDVSLTTESATHDEAADETGAGNTDTATDVTPAAAGPETGDSGDASLTHDIRAERAGPGDGRTYTIAYEATTDDGTDGCMGTVEVNVPHDQSGGAGWK